MSSTRRSGRRRQARHQYARGRAAQGHGRAGSARRHRGGRPATTEQGHRTERGDGADRVSATGGVRAARGGSRPASRPRPARGQRPPAAPAAATGVVIIATASSPATTIVRGRRRPGSGSRRPRPSAIQNAASAPGSTDGCRRSASGPRPATITAVAAALPLEAQPAQHRPEQRGGQQPASRHRPRADCSRLASPRGAGQRRQPRTSWPRNPAPAIAAAGVPTLAPTTGVDLGGAGRPSAGCRPARSAAPSGSAPAARRAGRRPPGPGTRAGQPTDHGRS